MYIKSLLGTYLYFRTHHVQTKHNLLLRKKNFIVNELNVYHNYIRQEKTIAGL